MAEIPGIQFKIEGNIDNLKKSVVDAADRLGTLAKSAETTGKDIGDKLNTAAEAVRTKYGSLAGDLAAKLAGLVNPAALASAAVAALGTAFAAYLESGQEKVKTLDEVIKNHGLVIKDIQKAYGDATEGLKNYAAQSANVLGLRLAGSLADLQAQIKGLSQQITEPISRVLPALDELSMRFGDVHAAGITVQKGFEPFYSAIERLRAGIANGNPDIRKFQEEVAALVNQAGNTPELVAFGNKLLDVSKNAFEVEQKINQSKDAIAAMAGVAGSSITNIAEFEKALKRITEASPITKSPLEKLKDDLVAGLAAAGPDDKRIAEITAQYDKVRKQIMDADASAAAEKAALDAERRAAELAAEKEHLGMMLNNMTLSWATQEEKLWANLTRRQELIKEARDKEVIDDATHKALMEKTESEHQKALQSIRDRTNSQALRSTASMFGSLQSLTESFGKKNTALSKAFGIAQALINTYVGVTQALRTLPPPASYAAAAATLAQGLAQVASIRSISDTGKGGGGGASASSGGGAAAAAASGTGAGGGQTGGNSVYINLQGQSFGRDQVRSLVEQIAAYQKDGGQVVFG